MYTLKNKTKQSNSKTKQTDKQTKKKQASQFSLHDEKTQLGRILQLPCRHTAMLHMMVQFAITHVS